MFESPVATATEEKRILENFIGTIPESVFGPDRVRFIMENAINLDEQDKIALRNFVNQILTHMIENEASDIEIGGHGNEGYIWMRIHGKKERVRELQQFSED